MSVLRRTTGAAALLLVVLGLLAGPAGAQDGDDPYGSTSTTRRPPRTATIQLSVSSGPRGTSVEARACGYAAGAAGGSITFSGQVVAAGLFAGADGCLTTDGSNRPTFSVPPDSKTGSHPVCAVLAGYNSPCARFRVTDNPGRGRSEVEGVQIERGSPGGSSSGNAQVLGVSLPVTGLAVGVLVVVALTLMVVGRVLLESPRHRRSSAPR
jgi:hypothetical protein